MFINIPNDFQDLISDDVKSFAFLATTMSNGSPQVTPVWFNTDSSHLLINSAKGRIKDINMRNRPNVAIVIVDPQDPYRYIQIRGRVVEIKEVRAREHINALSKKYRGKDVFEVPPNEIRVIYKISIEKTNTMG